METLTLTDQQGLRIDELPEDYRVIGIDRSAPFVRKPTGQDMRILQNGNLTAATTGAKDRLAGKVADEARRLAGKGADEARHPDGGDDGVHASAPYTSVVG